MKRYDEIQEMAKSYASHMTSDKDMQVAFADALRRGAEWADSTMIDKAYEWLESNCTHLVLMKGEYYDSKEIVEQFKKAMKGE